MIFFREDGSLLGDDGCTVATGGGAPWRFILVSYRLLPEDDMVTLVLPDDVCRLTALYVVIVGELDIAPS